MKVGESKSRIEKIMETDNWTELIGTNECKILMRLHRDICEETIKKIDRHGYIVEQTAFPRWCLNKYHLYRHLREHRRVPRSGHAEKILKQERKVK